MISYIICYFYRYLQQFRCLFSSPYCFPVNLTKQLYFSLHHLTETVNSLRHCLYTLPLHTAFTFFTDSIQNRILTLQGKSMTFFNMMRNFFHKMTFQMNDLSTFYTLQVQMLFTSPSRFYILISSLATFLCNIFDHSSILCKLVQIAVNGCDIYLTVMFSSDTHPHQQL